MASLHVSDSDQHEQPDTPNGSHGANEPANHEKEPLPTGSHASDQTDSAGEEPGSATVRKSEAVTQPLHPLLSERQHPGQETSDVAGAADDADASTPVDEHSQQKPEAEPNQQQSTHPASGAGAERDTATDTTVQMTEQPHNEQNEQGEQGGQDRPSTGVSHSKATAPLSPAEDEEPAEPAESSAEDADDPTDADGTSGEQSEEPVEHAADDEPAEEHGLEIVEVPDDTSVPDTEDEESPEDATVHMSELESADISTDMFNKTGTLPSGEENTQMLDTERMPAITTHRSHQMLAAAAHRDVGRVRQNNQDSVLSLLTYLPREGTDMPLGLFVVADGMGGHAGGEIASRLAIRTIAHHVFAQLVLPVLDDGMIEALQPMMIAAVQEANHVIWEHAQNAGSDMGTTCTAALLLGRAFYIAHVGDSRAYLMQPGGLKVLTSDHSTVGRLIELGQLDPSAAHNHPLRNQLYRTIGQQSHVEVDFTYQPIENSTHLLLCSDGLWGMVSDDHIEQALKRSPWPQDICDELIAMANLAGGEDNISAVVVTLPVMERLRS